MSDEGIVYLLHFDRPFSHARHYVGWTSDLAERLDAHRQGTGARLLAVIHQAGISFQLVRAWRGSRALERRIKRYKGSRRICPLCRPHPRPLAYAPPEEIDGYR